MAILSDRLSPYDVQVRESKLNAIFIFIAPPTLEELERRLRGRNTESADQIKHRLSTAKKEMERSAMSVLTRLLRAVMN